MIAPSLIHHTFSLERRYPVPAAKVFAAWGDPGAKRRWFSLGRSEHAMDFRVGGLEVNRSVGANGKLLSSEGAQTVLLFTESDIFLDGQEEPAWREQGTADWLSKLDTEFASR